MAKKQTESLGTGIVSGMGFLMGLVLIGLLWLWYTSGFADTTTTMTTAVILVVVVLVIWYVIMYTTKNKYADAYQKAFWWGIGFFVALLIAGFILGYLGLSASMSVSTLVVSKLNKNAMWI